MVSFIDAHRPAYGVEPICRVLPIAPSTYYEMKSREADPARLPARAQRDLVLRESIRQVWEANKQVSGLGRLVQQPPAARADRVRATSGVRRGVLSESGGDGDGRRTHVTEAPGKPGRFTLASGGG